MYLSAQEIYEDFFRRINSLKDINFDSIPNHSSLSSYLQKDILDTQITARLLDIHSRILKTQNKTFYTISSAGHEMMAVIGHVSKIDDVAFAHYRDASFYIQRAKKKNGSTPIHDIVHSFMVTVADPISGGRHKVLGHVDYFMPPQTSTIASHLPKALGTALSINRSKKLKLNSYLPYNSVVTCHFGDATLFHATALTAINCAEWLGYNRVPCPIVFVCEDNQIGISQKTSEGWVQHLMSQKSPYIKYIPIKIKPDSDLCQITQEVSFAYDFCRKQQRPVFIHLQTVRLHGHAGNDREDFYRSTKDIKADFNKDPITITARNLIQKGILSWEELHDIIQSRDGQIQHCFKKASDYPKLQTADQVIKPITLSKNFIPVNRLSHSCLKEATPSALHEKYTLAKALNKALDTYMSYNSHIALIGLDIAKKGGVYNITNGLYKKHGAGRVMNAPLDETTILGTGIGFGFNGFLPICEIQFLAYYHNAQDQIRGEAATLSFFSNGQYQNGILVRIPGLAYQEGLGGHYHNDNTLTVFRDIPGAILACVSHPNDVPAILAECINLVAKGRIVFLVEPIALYHKKDLVSNGDNKWLSDKKQVRSISLGDFAYYPHHKTDTLVITYGNGHYLSAKANHKLINETSIGFSIIDLRWLNQYNQDKLIDVCTKYKFIIIVDECRPIGALADELVTLIKLNTQTQNKVVKKIQSSHSFITLGPSTKELLVKDSDITVMINNLRTQRE